MRLMKIVPYLVLGYSTVSAALAHEFWVSPEKFVYSTDEQVQVNLRVGQKFAGSSYSYNPNNFTRFDLISGGKTSKVTGRLGDIPALAMTAPGEGLLTVVHETDDSLLTYTKWAKFVRFAEHKAFPTTLEDHVARGIPKDEKFVESYRRFAKSLIAIGNGAGKDAPTGLRTEIVALNNPYRTETDYIAVQVLLDGKTKNFAQVELFEKSPEGDVAITLHTADAKGEATLPIKRGYSYLVDSVAMVPLENDNPEDGPVWKSLWASLTFKVPDIPLK